KLMASLAKTALVILDDWGLAPLRDEHRRDVLELLEDRHGRGATMVTSQLPVDHWHDAIGDPTLADAILDRLLHDAYKITLRGDSMRKRRAVVKNDVSATSPDQPRRRCAPMGDRWGAAFVRIGWQASVGLSGSFAPDWVAGITGIRTWISAAMSWPLRRTPRSRSTQW